jgi:ABC-type transport system involved in multi-copper enzyme maturation permease subunit
VVTIGPAFIESEHRYQEWPNLTARGLAAFDPFSDPFNRDAWALAALLVALAGALMIAGEYSSGLIRTTFSAVPARRNVMAAKVIVAVAVTAALGLVCALGSFDVSQAIMSGRHVGLSLGSPGSFRAVAASALLLPACALTGMCAGALIRQTAGTVVATIASLILVPSLVRAGSSREVAYVVNVLPLNAWTGLTPGSAAQYNISFPPSVTAAWVSLVAWLLACTAITVTAVARRDV